MTIGPVEYLVVAFPGGDVSDDFASELGSLVDKDLINILDVVFLTKDADGDTNVLEFDEIAQLASFAEIDGEAGGLIGPDDISFVASEIEPGSAAVLLIEDRWAASLAGALDRTGGVLADGFRIPRDLVDEALTDLPVAS